jgi:hypothetical protein
LANSDLGLNKAPGPNGMIGLFYESYWPIVKESVVNSVQSFFRGVFLLKEFNHTNIALSPKTDNPWCITLDPLVLLILITRFSLKFSQTNSNLF